ncbi:multidrug transporter subunit MdtN [Moellerella wisconsensis]|uniref:Multidrug transporter subunit MdtN n=1 Tax=Moellerella wisconsensis TaxID=158849 RepID=A0ACD3Y8A4_9GAMM|nr:multidrug transporter subunit MdtN [Moellerella wisconsensis]KLN96641.1 hemolysin D [Moellerella wisconsensis]UNH24516.1 multidrug transporter subunit MdtN [Moellerella wisconsensis]UNH27621.1 multidrug transporter subunit MdtN [Moellerella wisconsensis]UNH39241.1 multidrug transporter subunit MdtN [Moellerella wisconsensis]UNH42763.1 multidrug transporter subunit MdtN [Moellerella wisconsensis]
MNTENKKKLAIIITLGLFVILVLLLWKSLQSSSLNPLSEEAVIEANKINISSVVPGRISQFYVKENIEVKKGDLLFTIDPTMYQLRVNQAKAELAVAEATLNNKKRVIIAETSNSEVAEEQIKRAQVNLALATQSLKRLEPLLAKGFVTAQQVDDARTLKRDAEVSLRQAQKQNVASEALINNTKSEQALVESLKMSLAMAEWELSNTQIKAPSNGYIVGLSMSAGEFVLSGQSIFTLIDTDTWFASAYFKETELNNIRMGSCAVVYSMINNQQPIKGKVQGTGWGVMSTDLLNIPRDLPYVPKSLNWVRVEQRFPVRIILNNPPKDLMRVGATATVNIVAKDDDC